jgi:hypothetical protein
LLSTLRQLCFDAESSEDEDSDLIPNMEIESAHLEKPNSIASNVSLNLASSVTPASPTTVLESGVLSEYEC